MLVSCPMYIPDEIVEKIRQSIDIVDVINDYVPLKRAGAYYRALSPFNKEKTPSFMVSPSRQSFKCYSSGHGGDIFKFLMLYENMDFPSAVRRLADRAGVAIPEADGQKDNGKNPKADHEGLFKLHAQLALYWRDLLLSDPRAEHARQYLQSRDMPLDWVKRFTLGYAPDGWEDTLQWAKKNHFQSQLLLSAGLAKKSEKSCKPFSFFRDRLMFPIHDDTGRIVAFSARTMKDEEPKYINSPETAVYKKGKTLFGFHSAKRPILNEEFVLVCEGQIDVLRCHAEGVENAVAPLGTAFTEEHCRLLKRFSDRIVLCLDADRAGRETAERLGEMILGESEQALRTLVQSDLGLQIVALPAGHDPDSIIREKGVEAFREYLKQPTDYLDFYIEHLLAKEGDRKDSPAARRRIVEKTARLLARISNGIIRDRIAIQAANKLNLAYPLMREEIQRADAVLQKRSKNTSTSHEENTSEPVKAEPFRIHPLVQDLIFLILSHANIVPDIQRQLHPEWLQDMAGSELLQKIIDAHNNDEWNNPNDLPNAAPEEQNYLAGLVYELDELVKLTAEDRLKSLQDILHRLELEHINRKIALLNQQISQQAGNTELIQSWAKEMPALISRKSYLTKK